MRYNSFAVRLFGKLIDKFDDSFIITKNNLLTANIKIPLRTYISVAFLTTLLAFLGCIAALIIILKVLALIKLPEMTEIILLIFGPTLAAISTFAIFILYPSQIAVSRQRNIETNLPFVLTHMGAVAESGIPPQIIFKLISEFEEYGDVAMEMKKIVKNMDEFGVDPLTAVRQVAERTPSDSLRQLLLGFVSTIESGGDIKMYLKSTGQQSLFEWRIKREKFLQQLSAYAEFYTGLLIAAPLFIISLFAVMNMIQPDIAGYNILDLTKLSIYLLVPSLNIGFLLFLRGVEVEI